MNKAPQQLQNKIQKLPPWARGVFADFVEELYERESNMVVGFLEASRRELRGELTTVKHEQEQLRGTPLPALSAKDRYTPDPRSASLASRGVSQDKLQRYLQRKLAEKAPRSDSRSSTSMSYMSEASLNIDSRPGTSFSRAGTFSRQEDKSPAPPRTPRRSTPAPPKVAPKQEEEVLKAKTEELIAAASEVEAKNESERDRQWEKVRRAKERKKQRQQAQADLASQMLDLAREVAAAQSKEKEKQEQKIKERLEEMKRKKGTPEVK